jgi:hypothetical protein
VPSITVTSTKARGGEEGLSEGPAEAQAASRATSGSAYLMALPTREGKRPFQEDGLRGSRTLRDDSRMLGEDSPTLGVVGF